MVHHSLELETMHDVAHLSFGATELFREITRRRWPTIEGPRGDAIQSALFVGLELDALRDSNQIEQKGLHGELPTTHATAAELGCAGSSFTKSKTSSSPAGTASTKLI